MIGAICIFISLQILGDLVAAALSLPFPGALIGMIILILWLVLRGKMPEALASGADALHRHLGLFFVPVGVSLAGNLELMREQGPALLLIILVSTWLSIAAVGLFAQRMFCGRAGEVTERGLASAAPTEQTP